MGDTFCFGCGIFHGYAVEDCFLAQGAPALGRSGAGTSSTPRGHLPPVWGQPQNRLQVAGPISPAGSTGAARSIAPAAALAQTTGLPLGQGHRPPPAAAALLGRQENPPPASPRPSPPAAALAFDDSALAPARGLGAPAPAPRPPRPHRASSGTDGGHTAQPGLDGRLQGLVPHRRRGAAGTADRARSVQPLRTELAVAAQPGRPARAPLDAAALPPARRARGHPGGQWLAFWRQGGVGTLAPVGVVAAGWASGSSSPGGPVRATTRRTNSFTAAINARWWPRARRIARPCSGIPSAGWFATTRSVRTGRWADAPPPKCIAPAAAPLPRCCRPCGIPGTGPCEPCATVDTSNGVDGCASSVGLSSDRRWGSRPSHPTNGKCIWEGNSSDSCTLPIPEAFGPHDGGAPRLSNCNLCLDPFVSPMS